MIDFGSQLVKSTFGTNTNKVNINIIIWLTLANISHTLRSFILQNSCSGSCNIPAAIKLAEKTIPSGRPRIMYGFDVYAGKKYATIIATKYTIAMIINLVHTNFQYRSRIWGYLTPGPSPERRGVLRSSSALIFQSLLTAITYSPKSAIADQIAKNFSIVL